jgi:hypothetical protein
MARRCACLLQDGSLTTLRKCVRWCAYRLMSRTTIRKSSKNGRMTSRPSCDHLKRPSVKSRFCSNDSAPSISRKVRVSFFLSQIACNFSINIEFLDFPPGADVQFFSLYRIYGFSLERGGAILQFILNFAHVRSKGRFLANFAF